ncbi:MAG: response regulator [Myxococcales bacterium]|nr:response regulator [Myxococcales bacterium]
MKTVLVVDDSQMMRRIVARAVSAGAEINLIEAENGQQALEILQKRPVDVLLLDLNMPVMGGEELLGLVSDMNQRPGHIVVITSTATASRKLRLMRLGAKQVLSKPFKPEKLFLELRPYLQPGRSSLDDEHLMWLDTAVTEAVAQIAFRMVEPCDHQARIRPPILRASVSLTGAWEGELVLILSERWCSLVSQEIIGQNTPNDFAGELANIVGGSILSRLEAQMADEIGLQTPNVRVVELGQVLPDRYYTLEDQDSMAVQWSLTPAVAAGA